MSRFRKRPVEIEAVEYTPRIARHGWGAWTIPTWLDDAYEDGTVTNVCDHNPAGRSYDEKFANPRLAIRTLEGTIYASPGDWIIRGVAGEIYPCKPDIFAKTYEEVEEA